MSEASAQRVRMTCVEAYSVLNTLSWKNQQLSSQLSATESKNILGESDGEGR